MKISFRVVAFHIMGWDTDDGKGHSLVAWFPCLPLSRVDVYKT